MKRIPGTPFAADFWAAQPGLRFYFLSHLHADHTSGLSDAWRHGTIYCSPVTKQLLHLKWPGIPPALVVPLAVGETHQLWLDEHHSMAVSLIGANHCPGAVMFLWEGYFGQLLYTGDFRYHPSMFEAGPLARPSLRIDTLFVDNTYLSAAFEFPSQSQALRELVGMLERKPAYRSYTVLVGVDTLGKERLLVDLAMYFGSRVEVAPERYLALQRIFECGELLQEHFELFFDAQHPPSNYGAGPLFVLSSRRGLGLELAKRKETLLLQNPQQTPLVLGVIPTGWVSKTTQKKPKHESHAAMLRVPYSIHSSYGEILELIRRARPCRVVPIVPDSPCPYDVISPLLSGEAPRSIDYAEAGVDMDATAPVRAVAGGSKRPRAQVSAERAAQIADATRRERERLRVKQEEIKVKRDGAMSNKEIIIVRDHSDVKRKLARKPSLRPGNGIASAPPLDVLRMVRSSAALAREAQPPK